MGFKRNYQVRIPSNHLNNLRSYSTVSSRVANSLFPCASDCASEEGGGVRGLLTKTLFCYRFYWCRR